MTKNEQRVWILGAADPEMAAIEAILRRAGETVVYAVAGGVRVHPGNAYQHDPVDVDHLVHVNGLEVVAVECDGAHHAPGEFGGVPCDPHRRIDHHRPGDPGYGKGPEDYWSASSLGQVCSLLGLGDPPEAALMVAAADHCLEAAYRGRCPGVDPERLMEWRAQSRAAFQKREVAAVLADIDWARRLLREAVAAWTCPECGGSGCLPYQYPQEEACGYCGGYGGGGPYPVARLDGQGPVPELPEAAAREGIPYIATVTDRDGREKVVLGAAPPDMVERFLDGTLNAGYRTLDGRVVLELTGKYGDPARGFAGGYV